MTRTERNQDPRALLKDRHSRSGLIKSELIRKNGAGAHNWGSNTQQHEAALLAEGDARDEQGMFDMEGEANDAVSDMAATRGSVSSVSTDDDTLNVQASAMTNQKDMIATSPTDSMSSMSSAGEGTSAPRAMPSRRKSSVSDEDREKARSYREGVMHKGGYDLANIAKTSYGVAQSPPSNGFSGSPTKYKGGFGMSQ